MRIDQLATNLTREIVVGDPTDPARQFRATVRPMGLSEESRKGITVIEDIARDEGEESTLDVLVPALRELVVSWDVKAADGRTVVPLTDEGLRAQPPGALFIALILILQAVRSAPFVTSTPSAS